MERMHYRELSATTIEFAPMQGHASRVDRSDYSLAGALAVLRRHWTIAATAFLAVALATTVFVLRLPSLYEAEIKLLINRARIENPVSSDGGVPLPPTHTEVSDAEVTSEIELLKSKELLAKVAMMNGLAPSGNSSEDARLRALAVEQLIVDLRAAPIKKTSLIGVVFVARDANQAAKVLNTAVDLYIEKHLAVHRKRGASEFFTKQAADYKDQLETAQRMLGGFEQHYQAVLLDRQKEGLLQRSLDLQTRLEEVNSQIRDAENRAGALREQLKSLPATLSTQNRSARNEALLEKFKTMLVQLEHRRTELLTRYEPGYRLVQEVEKEIKDTRQAIERESNPAVVDTIQALNPIRQSVEAELMRTESVIAGLRARQKNMQNDFGDQRVRQNGLSQITASHEEILRRVKIAEENYMLYQKKQEEARIAEAMDRLKILNISIVDHATPPALPVKKHRLTFALLGLVAGFFLALAAAFIADQFDQPIRVASDLRAASGLPVLDTRGEVEVRCS